MALDPKFKRQWVKALRKGTYDQTTEFLRVTPSQAKTKTSDRHGHQVGHCCLGVGCEISRQLFPDVPVDRALEREAGLTKRQMHAWGLSYEYADKLAEMNDHGKTFAEIADFIEANL